MGLTQVERAVVLVIPPGALEFGVPGKGVSGNRMNRIGGGRHYRNPDYKLYRDRVYAVAFANVMRSRFRVHGYCAVHFTFWNTQFDVLDNAPKPVSDAVNGVVWEDDRYVLRSLSEKRKDKGGPRVELTIYPIDGREFGYSEAPPVKRVPKP